MFDELFAQVTTALSITDAFITLGVSLVLGLLISATYIFINRKNGYDTGFVITLVMMPMIISIIILLIGNNIARAFSLAGVFSLVRYRSEPGDPRDITYIFFSIAAGLACGVGYIGYSILFVAVLCVAMLILYFVRFAEPRNCVYMLKITVPENLNFEGAFDDILNESLKSWKLNRIRTDNFGTVFDLIYTIRAPKNFNRKEFIDKLRCRNGNFNITLSDMPLEVKKK